MEWTFEWTFFSKLNFRLPHQTMKMQLQMVISILRLMPKAQLPLQPLLYQKQMVKSPKIQIIVDLFDYTDIGFGEWRKFRQFDVWMSFFIINRIELIFNCDFLRIQRPKFLQYRYMYDYRTNYYNDVIEYLDKRAKGINCEPPRAQTWAERVLRTHTK